MDALITDASAFVTETMASVTPDARRPLHREAPAALAFPMQALGALRPGAEAIAKITQCPPAIAAQSVLAVTALAIQAHRDVEGPGGIGRRPLCGLFVSRAESGERKSAADRLALKPVVQIEKEWRQQAELEVASYQNAKDSWDEARTVAKRNAKGDRAKMLAAFEAIGPEPKPPRVPTLLVEDATPEGVVLHLADARPFCGQFSAEGGLIVGGTGMSQENRMRAGATYNVFWDGGVIRRNRAVSRSAFLPGRRVTLHLMMQPSVASALLADAQLTDLGTVARMLLVAPDTTAGTRFYREPAPEDWRVVDDYAALILKWLRRDCRTEEGSDALDPEAMQLDDDARELLIAFHNKVEAELAPGGDLASIRSWGSKMAEHALRLAALLAAANDAETLTVNRQAMADGIALAKYYGAEMLRLAGDAGVSPDLRLARDLRDWWQARKDPRCHLAQIYQNGPIALRDAAAARRIVVVLVEHGWGKPLPPQTVVDGKTRKEAWELVA